MKKNYGIYLLIAFSMLSSCKNEDMEDYQCASTRMVSSIIQDEFDWENADFMPTPAGSTPISTPWIGQGSLIGTYELDVINDRKKQRDGVCYIIPFQQTLKTTNKIHSLYFIMSIEE